MSRTHSILRNSRAFAAVFLLAIVAWIFVGAQAGAKKKVAQKPISHSGQTTAAGYVGSQECALCHQDIFEKYSRTDMGRSMVVPDSTFLSRVPDKASVFDQRLNRHLELYAQDGNLYQSEYELLPNGREVFRDARKIDWIIGAGANGLGGLVRQGDYLFEAPLSYYSNIRDWALSPGYQYADFGFTRPILPGCIVCHSGRAQPLANGNGRFGKPPFLELAVGCENCHGPGEAHIAAASPETIVNPAKLSGWRADNICIKCHQTGDARVLRPGKDYNDFRPGAALDETLSIFVAPFDRQSPPRDDLLEHFLSMRLSKCYRGSQGKMSCITCHDPHLQLSVAEAPAYFRRRCLSCHSEQSCTVPVSQRQAQNPPDDCSACHMPKRDVQTISHSVLTNHRIVKTPQEPFPDSAFHMTTPELPDLVLLSAPPGKRETIPRLMLLQAYRQVMLTHPEYRKRYWDTAKALELTHPEEVVVLEALADLALQQRNWDGVKVAIEHLDRARAAGSTQPTDYEELAKMLIATHQEQEAEQVLEQGIKIAPYDAQLYRMLIGTYSSRKDMSQACKVAAQSANLFPQDDQFRQQSSQCGTAGFAQPH